MLSCDRQVSWLFKMRISVEVSEKPQAQGRTVYARVKGNEVHKYGLNQKCFDVNGNANPAATFCRSL